MTLVRRVPRLVARLAEQHVVLFVIASIVFWTLLWPLAIVWSALSLVDRHRALDHSPAARRHRRVLRLLRWYPPEWRARYGDEMAELLDDVLREGRSGLRLTWNMAVEGIAARLAPPARRQLAAGACLGLCWLPLVPQGLVAASFKTFDVPTRSWFVALYAPTSLQWPLIGALTAIGVAMLTIGLRVARTPVAPLPDGCG